MPGRESRDDTRARVRINYQDWVWQGLVKSYTKLEEECPKLLDGLLGEYDLIKSSIKKGFRIP